jgi:hypothetical protein
MKRFQFVPKTWKRPEIETFPIRFKKIYFEEFQRLIQSLGPTGSYGEAGYF